MEESVKIEKLGNIVDVKGGKRLPKGISLISTPNNHPYIRIRDLGASKILELNSAYEYVDDETQKTIARYIVSSGDILISIVGTIGLVGIVGDSLHGANQTENCVKLVNLKGIDRDYLYYFLSSNLGQNEIKRGIVGAVQSKLPIKNIENINIPLPSLALQKSIASILSSLDSKIELNRRINDNLEQQAQLLFDNLIDASDWSTTQFLSELSEINPPRKLSKGEYAPFVEMSNMPTSGSFPSRIDYKEYNGGMKFRNGDTIMARITPCLENGKAAYVNFLKENEIGFGSTEYIVLAPKKTISSSFLYFLVRNKDFVDYAVKHMNGSSGRQRVSGDTIGNYQLPILDRNKLSIFIAIADRTLSKIRQNSFEILNLAKQRDTLLPKLMSGELKINDLNC